MTHPLDEAGILATRRQFLTRGAGYCGLGAAALNSLLVDEQAGSSRTKSGINEGLPGLPHARPRARRVIYLFQSGAPSQIDLLDYKPSLEKLDGTELPDTIRKGQRLTGMTSRQSKFTVTKSPWKFRQCGESGIWLSDLIPWHQRIADHMCLIKTMHTEAINHDPAITFVQSGHQQPGRPCLGSWASYGLGSQAKDLPAFVVLLSKCTDNQAQPLYSRLWGAGFLPSNHQGVKLRGTGDPVLYLNDPTGETLGNRRAMLDKLAQLNELHHQKVGDPEVQSRISAYEMAYRMQISVPGLLDFSDEPASTWELYGEDAKIPGTHAANCLLARRLAERDVRFIQLYHRGWDHHSNLPGRHPGIARQVDRGSAALVLDLQQRGLLEDTLVVWGGEFGRTVYAQGNRKRFGRDHHPRCFSVWMAGGGVRAGHQHGQTDDFCYNIEAGGVHVHDLNATILHLLGVDHERLTYRFQGRDYRLTDVHGKLVTSLLE